MIANVDKSATNLRKTQISNSNLSEFFLLEQFLSEGPAVYASLVGFQPDDEHLEMTGSGAGALNMHLEHLFGHAASSDYQGYKPILLKSLAFKFSTETKSLMTCFNYNILGQKKL